MNHLPEIPCGKSIKAHWLTMGKVKASGRTQGDASEVQHGSTKHYPKLDGLALRAAEPKHDT